MSGFAGKVAIGYSGQTRCVVGLTGNAAAEYGPQGLRINCVGPACIDTNNWPWQTGCKLLGPTAWFGGGAATNRSHPNGSTLCQRASKPATPS